MIDRAWERWATQNAGLDAELETAGDDPVKQLCVCLRRSGTRATFDSGRNGTHPCTFCGRSDEPRELVTIGRYLDGEELIRPVCSRCRPIADVRRMKLEVICLTR